MEEWTVKMTKLAEMAKLMCFIKEGKDGNQFFYLKKPLDILNGTVFFFLINMDKPEFEI